MPDSLQGAIAHRLQTVTADVAELLETVSALGPTSVRELRDALPGADPDALLARAERQGLLVVEEDLGVRFSHPLIGSVVYGRMSPLVRRSLHARLAGGAGDADVRARHLALSTDDESAPVAQLLEEAASRARDREAYDLAADFAGHSLRLTPADDGEAALRRAQAEIEYLATAGEMSRALALADRLVATLSAGPARAEALLQRAYLEDDEIETGADLLRQALEDVGADDPLRARVLDQLGWSLAMFQGRLTRGLECARESLALADRAGDLQLQMYFTATLASSSAGRRCCAVAAGPRPPTRSLTPASASPRSVPPGGRRASSTSSSAQHQGARPVR